MMLC
jgi:hypothetical protein